MHVRPMALTLAVLLALGMILNAAPAGAQDVTLTFWSWRTEDVDAYNQFIKAFEAEHPGIHVRFIPYRNTEYNTILATALQAGSGPDIIHLRAYGGME
ncbi:MAG TPA: extracellular solute-binding protein, partial [Limnochorda sp.]